MSTCPILVCSPWVVQYMLTDILHNPDAYTKRYSICVSLPCVLENEGISECYTGFTALFTSPCDQSLIPAVSTLLQYKLSSAHDAMDITKRKSNPCFMPPGPQPYETVTIRVRTILHPSSSGRKTLTEPSGIGCKG